MANDDADQGPALDNCRLAERESYLDRAGWQRHPKACPSERNRQR